MRKAYVTLLVIAVVALLLASSSAFGDVIYKGQSKICRTTYKNGSTRCVGIQGAGAATGCITAGTPTQTNNNGQSSVTINWASPGNGRYDWYNVPPCVPNPLSCTYICSSKAVAMATDEELNHAAAIDGYTLAVRDVFAGNNPSDIVEAIERAIFHLYEIPVGPNLYDGLRGDAEAELYSFVGLEDVFAEDAFFTLAVGPAANADFALAWPPEADETDVEDLDNTNPSPQDLGAL
ncbi:MAG: hypothetical protein GY856_32110 [bacterium]|nr:hypothetical protein [bacterium]